MLHSFVKLYIHVSWSTKKREKVLTKELRPKLHRHILNYARENQIQIDSLSNQIEHVHALLTIQSDRKLEDIVRLLKGESSHWINSENLTQGKFSWQRGYGAFSISSSHVAAVRKYIENQDEHHRKKSYGEEYASILQKYGFNVPETDESVTN